MGTLRAITIFGALLSAAGDDPGRKTPVPAMKPTTAYPPRAEDGHEKVTLAYAYGDWLVWTIKDQVDFRTRAPGFRLRYFRQNLYQPATTQVFEMEHTHIAKKVVSVLEDGTVLLDQYRELAWIDREGKVSEEYLRVEGNASKIVQGFPDGVLVQVVQRPARIGHVYFAPIVKRKIEWQAKFRLTDGDGLPAYYPPRFLRLGDVIAWNSHLFDLKSRSRRKLDPAAGMKPWSDAEPTAFDGQMLVLKTMTTTSGNVAVSMADGRQLSIEYRPPKTNGRWVRIFAVRNRIGYFLDHPSIGNWKEWTVKAIDLTVPESRTLGLMTFPSDGRQTRIDLVEIPHVVAAEGLIIWNGSRWQTVPWLEKIGQE